MGLSEAMMFAFAATIICAFAIAEKIIDIDFAQFMPKNLKKAKMKRILAKRETPLQGARLQKDIKDSFENVVLWNVLFLLKLVRQCIRSIGKTVTFGFFSQGISVILTVRVRTRNFIPIKGRSSVHPVELRWN